MMPGDWVESSDTIYQVIRVNNGQDMSGAGAIGKAVAQVTLRDWSLDATEPGATIVALNLPGVLRYAEPSDTLELLQAVAAEAARTQRHWPACGDEADHGPHRYQVGAARGDCLGNGLVHKADEIPVLPVVDRE